MKKGQHQPFSLSRASLHCGQQILNLLPLILGVIAVASLLMGMVGILQHHTSVKFGDIHQKMVKMRKRVWDIAKDPSSRASHLLSHEAALIPKKKDIKPMLIIKETWKEAGLLNLSKFQWILNNKSICKRDIKTPNDTRIVPVLIHTFRDHFSERMIIRKTWGSIPIYKKMDVRLVFLLGEQDWDPTEPVTMDDAYALSDADRIQEKLEDEQQEFGDLVMGSFKDNSKNLTYKHMMGYKWVLNYCSEAVFVMKADENKFVDIIQWLDWRSKDLNILENNKGNENDVDVVAEQTKVPDLYCNLLVGSRPVRQEGNHFYSSFEDWPQSHFPAYCSSWAYGTTMDLIKKLYSVSSERKFFWIDDVYLGALLNSVKKKYDWSPVIKDCFKTPMGLEDKFRAVCGSDIEMNLDNKKEFGPVVQLDTSKGFEMDMMCLWKKTVHDIHDKFDTK